MILSKPIHPSLPLKATVRGIFVGDLHLKVKERYGTPNIRGISSRTEDKLNYLKLAIIKAVREHVDIFVLAGDIFDKVNPPEKLRFAFLNLLLPLIEEKIPTFILIGNHDTDLNNFNLQGETCLIRTTPDVPIYVVDKHRLVKNFLGIDLLFVAWQSDEEVKKILQENPAILVFGHFQAAGAVASGTEFHLSGGIEKSEFDRFIYSFLGHIHRFQYSNSFAHAGSIARVDMGEAADPKGFIYFEVSSDKLAWDFIDIHDREFINLYFSDPSEINLNMDVKDAIVKVVCEGSDSWLMKQDVTTIPGKLYEKGAYKVVHQFIHKNDKMTSSDEYISRRDYEKMVEDYSTTNKREDLKEMGLRILRQGVICD